jgi:hypothetical protein
MEITIPYTQHITHHLSDGDMKSIARSYIRKRYDIPFGAFIHNGKVMVTEEVCTSHRFDVDKEIRPATKQDFDIIEILDTILD